MESVGSWQDVDNVSNGIDPERFPFWFVNFMRLPKTSKPLPLRLWVNIYSYACQGDSGRALICVLNDRLVLYVIVLFGFEFGQPRSPGVHVRVETFVNWIVPQINEQ